MWGKDPVKVDKRQVLKKGQRRVSLLIRGETGLGLARIRELGEKKKGGGKKAAFPEGVDQNATRKGKKVESKK